MNNESSNQIKLAQERYKSIVYELFVINPIGKQLLESWRTAYFFRPIVIENQPVETALRDGENRFLRNLISSIEDFKIDMEKNNDR